MVEVTISNAEYQRLLKRDRELQALENAGVDNWCGYGYAMQELNEEEEG